MQFKRTIVAFSALLVMAGIIGYLTIGGSSTQNGTTHMLGKPTPQNTDAFKNLKDNMATLVAMNMVGLKKKEIITADHFLKLMAKYEEIKEMRSLFP